MAATPSGFKIRYPEFNDVPNATVQAALDDASRFVDDTWFAADRDRGVYALAAHMLATEGHLNNTTSGGAGSSVFGSVTTYKLGDATETYGSWGGGSGGDDGYAHLKTTAYGVQYLRIMRANVPAVAVV